MTITDVWAPPNGSIELADEPGWWLAPNGSIYADPRALEPTGEEAQRSRDDAREQAAQRTRQDAALVPCLIDRIQSLEMQTYLTGCFLEAACLMLAEMKACEEFLEAVLAGVLRERSHA